MSKLKIIEATYYDPKDVDSSINVTKVLIQMVDFDNDSLVYDGSKNDIFGDPSETHRKRLKIIVEYDSIRRTRVYDEFEPIDLPKDLKLEKNEKNFLKAIWDSLILEPNFFGIGTRLKPLFKRLYGKPSLLKKIILIFVALVIAIGGIYFWRTPLVGFSENVKKKYLTDYNDPSRVLDNSIFNVIQKMDELSTDKEKQLFIQNYSGLRTKGEQGRIVHATTSDAVSIPADIEVNSKILTCDFDKKWKQKFTILGENSYVWFVGVIDRYDINTGKLLLIYCNLLYR